MKENIKERIIDEVSGYPLELIEKYENDPDSIDENDALKTAVSLLSDEVFKLLTDFKTEEGQRHIIKLIEGMKPDLNVEAMELLPLEITRPTSKVKTAIYDLSLLINGHISINIEAQRYGGIKKMTGKVLLNCSSLILSTTKKGDDYEKIGDALNLFIYDGSFTKGKELLTVHHLTDYDQKTKLLNKCEVIILNLNNILNVLKEKSKNIKIKENRAEVLNEFEAMIFMYKYFHTDLYQEEINYLINKWEECQYMETTHNQFKDNINTYIYNLKNEFELYSREHEKQQLESDRLKIENDKQQIESDKLQIENDKLQIKSDRLKIKNDRKEIENDKQQIKNDRQEIENNRLEVENNRLEIENNRLEIENNRQQIEREAKELERKSEEVERESKELERKSGELEKASGEVKRASKEIEKKSLEIDKRLKEAQLKEKAANKKIEDLLAKISQLEKDS